MKSWLFLQFLFVLILFNFANSEKCEIGNVCDFEDCKCIKRGATNFYRQVIAGVPGTMEPSDPLYLDKITGIIRCVEYTLSNITMTGLTQCKVTKAAVQEVGLTYEFTLRCPKLVLNYNYDDKGNLEEVYIDGQGTATLTAMDYVIIFKGSYCEFTLKNDNKCRFLTKSNDIMTIPIGKLSIKATTLNKDKTQLKQALKYVNCNKKIIADYLQNPVIPKLINCVFMENLDTYLRTLTVEEVFPKGTCEK